jgi:glycosyltransferase involved in cell wall biosynthesis
MYQKHLPLVTIICTSYNHENYIKECLDGFIMQQTNFSFEIIVHDDVSTDATIQIVKEYESKYPHLFNNIYQTENQFSKREVNIWGDIIIPKSKGKYIAICEGDDYWTDPYKLQKQVDFLEQNEDYVLTLHHRERLFNHNFTFEKCNKDSIFLQCMVFKNFKLDDFYINTLKEILYGDAFIYYKLLSLGKCKVLDFNGAVYRIHENGIHSGLDRLKAIEKNLEALIKIKKYHKALNNIEIVKIIKHEITKSYIVLLQINFKKNQFNNFLKIFCNSLKNINFLNYLKTIIKIKTCN